MAGLVGAQALWFDVRPSSIPDAGRGVFCKRSFRKGEIVMQAPIVMFDRTDVRADSALAAYPGVDGDRAFLCFDYQGLVNTNAHANNVEAQWRLPEGISQFVALRDIAPGEELFQSYHAPRKL